MMKNNNRAKLAFGVALAALPGMSANASSTRWRATSTRQVATPTVVAVVAPRELDAHLLELDAVPSGNEISASVEKPIIAQPKKAQSPFSAFGRPSKASHTATASTSIKVKSE